MDEITYRPIGVIRSPFREIEGMPIQAVAATGITAKVELKPEFAAGLKDLAGFSHIFLIYHFHLSEGYSLETKPFMDDTLRGVFSTRAPRRPNPIGLSVVRLVKIEGSVLHIEGVDMVDGTPLLDIKPYVPELDAIAAERIGWIEKRVKDVHKVKADRRFKD